MLVVLSGRNVREEGDDEGKGKEEEEVVVVVVVVGRKELMVRGEAQCER